ncbi:MAG: hypothetical protein LW805_11230 [Oxalobacteraceae bacterium]|jgi:hypothetical protein|nr:hypothetical protein [Oxalobacteraceae bacterium]
MKRIFALSLLVVSGAVIAGDTGGDEPPRNKPFVMVDTSMEKDAQYSGSLATEYVNANLTMGVKTPSKTEYSVKVGGSQKDKYSGNDELSNNIELKIKQSFDIGTFFLPYVALRLGEKFNYTATHFTHYAFDAGLKVPMTEKLALDVGVRFRNAFNAIDYSGNAIDYRSTRFHAMALYDFDKSNTIGLRYTQSDSKNYSEERKGWRIHYQRNY